jgi:hypothetical protein
MFFCTYRLILIEKHHKVTPKSIEKETLTYCEANYSQKEMYKWEHRHRSSATQYVSYVSMCVV